MPDEPYLTVAQVAELLKLNEQTIRNWIDDGKLPCVRVGPRRVRVRRRDLTRFINNSSATVDAGPSTITNAAA